jgi:hypothetical protein
MSDSGSTFNILFDQWGTQVQVQQTMGGMRLNTLFGALKSAGASSNVTWNTSISTDPITPDQLSNQNLLIILTRAAVNDQNNQQFAYTPGEITAITNFVADGGGLLLISNHPDYGVNDAVLAKVFGITIDTTNFIAMPGTRPRPMMVMSGPELNTADKSLAPLFLGVDSLSTHDACGISSTVNSAKWLAAFPPAAKAPAGEHYGIFVPYQKGRVIVLGNSGTAGDNGGTPSPACGTVTYGSNLMFFLNCCRYLGGQPQATASGQCPN